MRYVLLSALLACGCTQDDQSLTIARYVTITGSTGACLADPGTTTSVPYGVLDVSFKAGYRLAPVVRNNLVSMPTSTTTELDNVYIKSFDVELKQDKGDTFLNAIPAANLKFNIPSAAGLVPPGAGQVATIVTVIPDNYVSMLQGVTAMQSIHPITVHIRALGDHSGVTLASSWSDYPVYLCDGCYFDFRGPCPAAGIPMSQISKGSCFIQEDAPITCCTDPSSQSLLCGSQVPVKMGM